MLLIPTVMRQERILEKSDHGEQERRREFNKDTKRERERERGREREPKRDGHIVA
jgi:hypothetical protein